MRRRDFMLGAGALALVRPTWAGMLDGLGNLELVDGLREGLSESAKRALARLAQTDGFYANARIRIGLPKNFKTAERVLRSLGQGKVVDDLVLASNRTAEAAAGKAADLVAAAIRKLTIADARTILQGGDGAATAYFRKFSEAELSAQLLPLVQGGARQSGLAQAYDALAAKLMELAGIHSHIESVEQYVNRKALDGIYTAMADEEKAIRADPAHVAGKLAAKVFGSLR